MVVSLHQECCVLAALRTRSADRFIPPGLSSKYLVPNGYGPGAVGNGPRTSFCFSSHLLAVVDAVRISKHNSNGAIPPCKPNEEHSGRKMLHYFIDWKIPAQ
ncbi:LOW QUALITY PROTEIN: hypothetical protein H100_04275 [Trichophyton rubrum MR850]|uniref:Uncharacterized protein n=1 Tax=Trichophyton rubrum (strain ATCC MYA-4607 / CBS 118892) TaxID=559305 RepID=A0A080WGA0_TRIRC|nr:LOW QUALITY PROTEIN: uncharacterized protein TERG_12094 [Trichophyton rubrum CBS 118892]EZF22756.1 LOW QUALITY PROTEIN: hypothetical protein H100_04275 [Trichophyton rubrum MR850]EZF84549.1 LOW QUALITY PROTEIN: hypothetical protein H110_04263 [Trichophyton rubrum MR1448]KFL61446.1 LOW QUALITY PROTEIN: hypothetical protein TERG_12094 [Trichophyton rubrum CBS 118892]